MFVVGAVIALAWFRHELRNVRSPLAQFDLRAAATAYRLAGERDLMQSLNRAGVRSMLLLGFMLVVAALAVGAFRSAVLLGSTMAITGILVEFLKISQPSLLTTFGPIDVYPTQWPSGHAAFQGSIALGMVLWWWGAGLPRPSLAAAVLVPFAVLVGYSRAFLGIHLLSEVLSGWLLAAAVAAFVVIVDRLVVPRVPAVRETVASLARRRVGARRAGHHRVRRDLVPPARRPGSPAIRWLRWLSRRPAPRTAAVRRRLHRAAVVPAHLECSGHGARARSEVQRDAAR